MAPADGNADSGGVRYEIRSIGDEMTWMLDAV